MLSWVFMPSMVTFSAPRGSPLTDELRGLPDVCTPGWVPSNSTALRVAKGSSKICRPPMVLETAALEVCTISAPPTTSTVSVEAPTSSLIYTVAGTPALTSMPEVRPTLNPDLLTAILYFAAAIDGSAHPPSSAVVVLKLWSVARLVTVTSAPGTAAPVGSVTTPSIRLVFTCEKPRLAKNNAITVNFFILIVPPNTNSDFG